MGPSARAEMARNPYCARPAIKSPAPTLRVPSGRGLPPRSARLRIDATHRRRVRDAFDCHKVGTEPQRHPVRLGLVPHLREGFLHDALQPAVDLTLLPEER